MTNKSSLSVLPLHCWCENVSILCYALKIFSVPFLSPSIFVLSSPSRSVRTSVVRCVIDRPVWSIPPTVRFQIQITKLLLFRQSANQPANQANQHKRVADNRLHPFKDIHLILLQLPPPLQQPTNQHTQQASFFFLPFKQLSYILSLLCPRFLIPCQLSFIQYLLQLYLLSFHFTALWFFFLNHFFNLRKILTFKLKQILPISPTSHQQSSDLQRPIIGRPISAM